MVQPDMITANVLLYGTMAFFTAIGLWAGRRGVDDTDTFLTARSTQNWVSLGTNFFAAGLGVWCFFALPQVGSDTGLLGVTAYAVSIVIPLLILGWIGPVLRGKVPEGVTITDFILARFGWAAHTLTNLIALLYMSVFLISELTALGFLLKAYNINVLVAQIILCISTSLYTCLSGMKASLMTDKFQGWIVLILMLIVSVAFGLNVHLVKENIAESDLLYPSRTAWESIYTLIVANLSANIFHQGYWQRVYSAKDNNHLIKASILASFLSFPVIFLIGITGVISVWAGLSERNDPLAFFNITEILPAWTNAVILMLATAFVSSSVDTLQNGIAATIVNDVFLNKVSLNVARVVSVLINVPVLIFAAKGYDIVSLFLIADLAAAIVVCPVLFGLLYGDVRFENNPIGGGVSDVKTGSRRDDPSPSSNNQQHRQGDCESVVRATGNDGRNRQHTKAVSATSTVKTSSPPLSPSQELLLLPNGFDFCMGVIGGLSSVVIFGIIFSGGDISFGFKLLSLPNGLSKPGESLGAFVAAPMGSMVWFISSFKIRQLIHYLANRGGHTRTTQFKDKYHIFNGTKLQ